MHRLILLTSGGLTGLAQRTRWWLISAPIYIKVFGIGMLISLLFASIAFYLVRTSVLQAHYQSRGEMALSLALSLSSRLESSDMSDTGRMAILDHELDEVMAAFQSVRYILVQDPRGKILSHGFMFPKVGPPDLTQTSGVFCATCHAALKPEELPAKMLEVPAKVVLAQGSLRAYRRTAGLILEVTAPIGDGHLGSVRLGVGDKRIAHDLASVNRSILAGIVLCLFATVCSALLLTYVLNKPIRALLDATRAVASGHFDVRAPIYSDDELGRLAQAFNRMAESLAESRQRVLRADRLAAVGQFAAGVAHEINNPLDGVMSCLARLRRDPANLAQNLEYLDLIQRALQRVTCVIQRLLEYAQTRKMNRQPEDVRTIIQDVVDFVRVTARHNAIEIAFDAPSEPLMAIGDRQHVEQALLNLALNGLAAIGPPDVGDSTMPGRRVLTFSVSMAKSPNDTPCVQVDVADSGSGIKAEHMPRIFDTFFTTKAPGKGAGLGLAIVKEIVESHGGHITVESVVGEGTVFHVLLPAAADECAPAPDEEALVT